MARPLAPPCLLVLQGRSPPGTRHPYLKPRLDGSPTMPTFTLLTFNCLGLTRVGTRRRLLSLARELEGAPYDAVCLQEVQAVVSRNLLTQACASYAGAYAPNVYGA